ncbi:hypothetical protein RIF29_08771 [Crotalaria pallida]|uniref:Cation/H+ exchanger domain-containing protein n=1 Tax=Crotalaria pallida TaxID=3830 RepID=A0AAN9FR44_CROPI
MNIISTLKGAKRCWRFGVISFVSSYVVTSALLTLYKPTGLPNSVNILINVFSLSSVVVINQALQELDLVTTEVGQIALSSSMISEIMQWASLSLNIYSNKGSLGSSNTFVISLPAFILFGIFVIRPMMKMIVRRTPMGQPLKETYVVVIFLGALISAGISDYMDMPIFIGPIIYGLVMPNGPPLATTITEKSEVIISQLLMPLFYTHIGIYTDFTKMHNWNRAIMFQSVLLLGLLAKIIDIHIFSQMVLYVLLATSICTPLIKVLYKHHPRVLKEPSIHERKLRMIQNTPENSVFNIVSCLHNDEIVHSMIALLEACNPSIQSPMCVHVIHLIELSGKFAPILLSVNKKNKKALSISYPNTNAIFRAFENYSNNSSGPVTILSYVNVAPYNGLHKAVCNFVEDNSVSFLIIPFNENNQCLGTLNAPFIRDLNTNFLASAQCTVGIFVDKLSRVGLSISKLCFHVGIFFIGGVDDREALTLGVRMLERSNMKVTLLRFVININNNSGINVGQLLNENEKDREEEMMLDESLVDEFKGKTYNNDNVVFHEIVVGDCIQLMEAIRGITEKDYDLVMVGKRHDIGDLIDQEMSNFMDNVEQLGIVGDMLASTEFCDGIVPVLVMQCGKNM